MAMTTNSNRRNNVLRNLLLPNSRSQLQGNDSSITAGDIKLNFLSSHPEAKVTSDILPGETGQVRLSGVYWRARSDESTKIEVGKKVLVIDRCSTTLIVLPA